MDIKNYLQLEGPPTLHIKLPVTSSTPLIETTVHSADATTKESTLPDSSPSLPTENKIQDKAKNLSSSLSPPPDCPITSPASLSKPESPQWSPRRRRSTPSPDSPANKARRLAMMYEANLVARDAIVYKETKASTKSSTDAEEVISPLSPLSPIEDRSLSPSVKSVDKTSVTHEQSSSSEGSVKKSIPERKKHRIKPDHLNPLLSEFVSEDLLLKSTPVVPPAETTYSKNDAPPPPLPKGYHGKIAESSNSSNNQLCTPKQDHSNRFQKVLRLSSQSSKLVRVVSGPHITFSVS